MLGDVSHHGRPGSKEVVWDPGGATLDVRRTGRDGARDEKERARALIVTGPNGGGVLLRLRVMLLIDMTCAGLPALRFCMRRECNEHAHALKYSTESTIRQPRARGTAAARRKARLPRIRAPPALAHECRCGVIRQDAGPQDIRCSSAAGQVRVLGALFLRYAPCACDHDSLCAGQVLNLSLLLFSTLATAPTPAFPYVPPSSRLLPSHTSPLPFSSPPAPPQPALWLSVLPPPRQARA